MFKITENAVRQILAAAKQSDAEGMALRIAAKCNQDGSIEYGMGFDDPTESDVHADQGGVAIIIDPPSNDLLDEATMDYVELEPGKMHFIFTNPLDPNYTPPKKPQPGVE